MPGKTPTNETGAKDGTSAQTSPKTGETGAKSTPAGKTAPTAEPTPAKPSTSKSPPAGQGSRQPEPGGSGAPPGDSSTTADPEQGDKVTWIADKAVKKSRWRTSTGRGSRKKAKRAVPSIADQLTSGGFPTNPAQAKKQLGKRFPKGPLFNEAEWNAYEQLSSTPQGQRWLNASGMLTLDEVKQYLSDDKDDNPEKFRGFHQLHKPSKVVLASYVSRQRNSGEGGKRFDGTPPAAVALSMEARHTTDPARKKELEQEIDQGIAAEWAKTLEHTEPNDDATKAITQGAVPNPTGSGTLSNDDVLGRHQQSLEVLTNVFHLLQEGAEIYDAGAGSHVPLRDVPVAKLLSHGGRVNIQIPAGTPPYAVTEFIGITDSHGNPKDGVFPRAFGTHHVALGKGKFKEEGGHVAAIKSKLDDTELYGINLAIGGLGLKDFNGDVILPDGAHGHIFIGHRPPRQDRPGALQIGIETTGPNAPSTVGYIHNWRSTEKTANPISSVGGLKQDKIGNDQIKNARTVDLGKLGDDWAGVLKDRVDRFSEDLKDRPAEAIQELVGPRANLPQETTEVEPRDADEASDGPRDDADRDSRDDDEASDEPRDDSDSDSPRDGDEASDEPPGGSKRAPQDNEASDEPRDGSKRAPRDGDRRDLPGDAAASPAKDTGSTAPPKANEGGFFATMPQSNATGDGEGSTADLEAEAMEALKAQETLRIFIPRAPGNGHQAASVQLMKRLVHLGFEGEFDVVYDDSSENNEKVRINGQPYGANRPKLESLLPGFKANGDPIQSFTTGDLRVNVMGLKTFQAQSNPKPAKYGLTGAMDNHEKPDGILSELGVDSFVQLQPMGWDPGDGKRGVTYKDSDGKEQFHEVEALSGLGYIYETKEPDDPKAMFVEELEKSGAAAKTPGMLALLEQTPKNKAESPDTHTMVVYGLQTGMEPKAPIFTLFNLITGVLYAQDEASAETDLKDKGVIIGVAGWSDKGEIATLEKMLTGEWEGGLRLIVDPGDSIGETDWEPLVDRLRQRLLSDGEPRATVINIEAPEARDRITSVGPRKVLVVEFSPDRLPMPVFEHLSSKTSLPNGFESVNGMDKERQNKPYFHVANANSNKFPGSDELDGVAGADEMAEQAKLVGRQLQGRAGLENWTLSYNHNDRLAIFEAISRLESGRTLESPRKDDRKVALKIGSGLVTGEGEPKLKSSGKNKPYTPVELSRLYDKNQDYISSKLQERDPDRLIGQYINDTQQPDSKLNQYFNALKERSGTKDQVKIAFTELIRVEKNPPPPPADDGMWTAPETGASAGDQSPAPGKDDDRAGAGDTAAAQSAPAGSAAPAPSLAELTDRGMKRGLRGSALDGYTSHAIASGDPDPNSYLKSLVDDIDGMPSGFKERAKELLEHPERIDQQDFAFCGLTAIAEAALHNNPMKAIDVFRSLFDATPFPLESGGAIDVTPGAEEVARGKDPSRNVLLGGRVKQIESMSEHTGKDYGDKRLDILLARALPKLWKTRARDKYDAWRESVESKFDANFGQGREQLQGDGARLKRGDFPMSDEAYTGILQDVFEAHEVDVLSAREAGYDIDAINALLEDGASAQFVHGIVLAGPVSAAAKGGGLGAPVGSSAGDQGLHQVRIVGPIETTTTPDGAESYVVPLSTYGKVIRLPVPKDKMGAYFPHILTGRWHEPAPPRAADPAQGSPSAAAPKSAAPSTGTSELFATMPKDKTTGDPERDEETDGEELASFINGLDEIRAYVPQGPGLGHQSSTINLVRRVVDQFDFQGTLRVVYDDSGTKQLLDDRAEARRKQGRGQQLNPLEKSSLIERTVEEKLALLVPGFKPAPGAGEQTVKLGAAQLVFTPESKAGGLPITPFGFTGGYDNKSDNLAARLKSDHVLKLQPFGWAHPRGRWARQPDEETREKIAKLKEQLGKKPPLAQQRQIKRELAALEAKQFTEMPSLDAKAHKWAVAGPEEFEAALSTTGPRGALVRHLMDEIDSGKPVIPLYGMGHAERAQDAPASHELFSLIAGTARAQQKDPGQFPEGVALVVTASLTEDHYRDLDALIHGPRDAGQRVLQNTTGGRGWNNPALDAFDSTVEELGLKERLLRVTVDDTEESVAKAMQAISELRQDQILLVQLGGFPPAVFEVFFSHTNMMGVLEGPNTANMMMSQGKPFVKGGGAAKEQLGAPPSKHGFERERDLIDKVSETLNGNLSSWLPGDAGPGLQRKDEDIADYLLSLGGEGSQIREYHRSLGEEYTSPNADAFADGMKDIIRAVRDGASEPTGAPAEKKSEFFATAPQTSASPADMSAGYNPAATQGAKGTPAPTTAATATDSPSGAEQTAQPQGSPLDDLIRTIEGQSSTWPRPADGEHREAAAQLLSRLLDAQGVNSSVIERLSTLIKDPASLSQSAFTNCALHSVLYTTLKNDLSTASHLVVALFTGKLLGRLAGAPGAGTFGQQGSGSAALSEGLGLIVNQMKGEGLPAPGPASTRPLVNGLKTAKAKHGRLKGQGASTQELDGHLLDHLLARGLVELLGRTAVAALEKQTDDAREPGVTAAEGDLLLSARSTAALMNAALGADAKIMTSGSPEGYDVARINEALGKTGQSGFALATVMNGKALWEEAAKREAGASGPQDPEAIPRLGEVDPSSPHLVAIDGPITVHGDSFLVPIQSWGRAFSVRVAKQDMPKLFAAFAYGTYPPARTPQASASVEVNPQASGGAEDALTGMAPRVEDFDSRADWRRFNERVRPWLGEIHRIRQPHDLRGAIDALSPEAARLLLRLYDEDPQRARVELRRLGRFNMNDTRRLSALLDRLTASEASDTELMEVELLSELEAIEQAQSEGEASDTDSFDLDEVLAFQGQLDALESAQSEFNQWMQEQLDGDPSEPEDAGEERSESGDSDAGMSESARLARANVQGMDQLHTAGRVQYSFNVPSEDLDELTEIARNAGVQGELADARTGFLNPDHFEKQSSYTWRLKPGVSASKALREFFNPEEHLTIAECGTTMQAINYRTILRAVGEEDFDRRFGQEGSTVPNEDRLMLQRDFSAQNPLQRFFAPEAATLDDEERAEMTGDGGEEMRNAPSSRPAKRGGWYYIKNHELYSRRHPEGFWSGENAMYLGRDGASGEQLFSGFGVAPRTEEQLADTLASEFNQEPTEAEVEKILGSGRDLSLALPTLGDLGSIDDMPLSDASMDHIARLHGHPDIDAAPREDGETSEDVARRLFRETLEGQPLQQELSPSDLVASFDLSELDRRALEAVDPGPAERSLGTWGVRAVPGAEDAASSHDTQAGTPRAVLRWTRPSSSRHGGQHTTPYTLVFDGYCKRFNFTFTPALMNLFLDLNRDRMRPVNPSERTVRKTTKIRVDEGAEFVFPLPSELNKLAKVPGGFQSIGGKVLSAEQIRTEFGRQELFSGAPSPADPADARAGYRPRDAASGRSDGAQTATAASTTRGEGSPSDGALGDTPAMQAGTPATRATGAPAALDGAVTIPASIDALVRTLVEKSVAWSSPRTQADKQEAIALVTELLQQLGMDARVVDRAGEQGEDSPDSEHSACTCVR
ncbi:hypothetical protein WMF27_35515 [Sorangium sp. So ce281]|uniref:hypothetical protein n=1 Tax=unclassified Sorangium TaxID=2621164 RepID=UPI003F6340C5